MKNFEGDQRKVGFEIEFQNLTPKKTAEIIARCTDGSFEKVSDASYKIDTKYGTFKAETDAKLLKKLAQTSEDNIKVEKFDFEGVVKDILTPLTKEVVPTEIVSPPLKEDDFEIISKIESEIINEGAKGTNESTYFAFATQFNPEIISKDSEYILNIIRAYILLTPWLRAQIDIGISREISSYVDDFPKDYALLVLDNDYRPNLKKLIDDYLEYNPTRNRGLDMLPLFLFLDKDRVRNIVKDKRVKARPTFHYRLPSCQLGLKSWNVFIEWKRWLLLESLADNQDYLNKMSDTYLFIIQNNSINLAKKWLQECNHFVEDMRS